MNGRLDALLRQIRHLEKELILEAHKKETSFYYEIHGKKVQFTEAAKVLQTRITLCQKLRAERSSLISRPKGIPTAANFTLARIELAAPQDGQVLVRNRYMSVDPYMRGRMNSGKSYVPPFEIGKPLEAAQSSEVIESRAEGFKPGDAVTSSFGWREYFIASPKELHPVSREIQPPSVYLGALGMTGMTAWAGLHLMEIRAGETIFISGAAGAVGSVAGQLAKLRGCRVIGSAGSMDKVMFLLGRMRI